MGIHRTTGLPEHEGPPGGGLQVVNPSTPAETLWIFEVQGVRSAVRKRQRGVRDAKVLVRRPPQLLASQAPRSAADAKSSSASPRASSFSTGNWQIRGSISGASDPKRR